MNSLNHNKISIHIGLLEDIITIDTWLEFVQNHPNGNIFQTPDFFSIYLNSDTFEPIAFFAISNYKIVGLLSCIIQKEKKGFLGKFTARSIIIGSPLFEDQESVLKLITTYDNYVNKKAIYSQFRNIFPITDIKNTLTEAKYNYEDHLDILIDLTKGENFIWNNIHKNRRKEIKNGIKKGLIVEKTSIVETEKLPEIYALLKKLYNNLGLPIPSYDFFYKTVHLLEPKSLLHVFIATVNEEIVGFRMVLTFKELIYDWYAASNDNFLNYRPNDVLPWEIMKWGSENGFSTFDFGGAGKPNIPYGVREYKMKFGGELVNFGRFQKTYNPFLYFLGVLGFKLIKAIKEI